MTGLKQKYNGNTEIMIVLDRIPFSKMADSVSFQTLFQFKFQIKRLILGNIYLIT